MGIHEHINSVQSRKGRWKHSNEDTYMSSSQKRHWVAFISRRPWIPPDGRRGHVSVSPDLVTDATLMLGHLVPSISCDLRILRSSISNLGSFYIPISLSLVTFTCQKMNTFVLMTSLALFICLFVIVIPVHGADPQEFLYNVYEPAQEDGYYPPKKISKYKFSVILISPTDLLQ